ncbi:MAG: homoserine kinase [Sneathiellales bacterium]|nr:homoserine kinase [Sneathiellales bacterium]
MAVYTDISDEDLDFLESEYPIGEILSCKGIAEGVENSNFLLHTEKSHFILTIYEKRVREQDLPFFLGLMEHLADQNFVSPRPILNLAGKTLTTLAGKPAAIIEFLEGRSIRRISAQHCFQLGEALAKLHIAAEGFSLKRENSLTLENWRPLFNACVNDNENTKSVPPVELEEVREEITHLEKHWPSDLPSGVIHADLFPDNIFFLNDRVSGVIDYYFACNDFLAYDVAVCLNAWCFESDASFNITKARKLLQGYQAVRKMTDREFETLPLLCQGAALRFYLTRLYDWINQVEGALVKPKNPFEYLRKIRFHKDVKSVSAYGID